MAQTLVLATRNKGKIREFQKLLADHDITLLGLGDYPEAPDVAETGTTFAQNALLKARAIAKFTQKVTVADDSGLVVDCLNGEPGVFSARYASDMEFLPNETVDAKNIRKLLQVLEGVPEERRSCRFVCCMAVVRPDGREMTVEGQWEGRVLFKAVGEGGFGYDPIFFDPSLGVSAAQLSSVEKSAVSHRGKATRLVLKRLPHFLSLPTLKVM